MEEENKKLSKKDLIVGILAVYDENQRLMEENAGLRIDRKLRTDHVEFSKEDTPGRFANVLQYAKDVAFKEIFSDYMLKGNDFSPVKKWNVEDNVLEFEDFANWFKKLTCDCLDYGHRTKALELAGFAEYKEFFRDNLVEYFKKIRDEYKAKFEAEKEKLAKKKEEEE